MGFLTHMLIFNRPKPYLTAGTLVFVQKMLAKCESNKVYCLITQKYLVQVFSGLADIVQNPRKKFSYG